MKACFFLFIKLLLIVKRLIIEAMHCFFLTCCWFGFLISRSIKIIVFHLFRKNIFPSFFPKISINKIDYFYFVKKSFRLKREFVSVVYFLFVLLAEWGRSAYLIKVIIYSCKEFVVLLFVLDWTLEHTYSSLVILNDLH